MKNLIRNTLIALLVAGTSAAYAQSGLNVTVSDPGGKVAYKGKTAGNGTFATGALQPGDYVVQFSGGGAKNGTQYALVVSAGKQKVIADGVDGGKFGAGGVAMKVKVGKGLNITGQVSEAQKLVEGNTKMKIVNGRRYYYVSGGTGTNLGGRWVEEGTPEARNLVKMGADSLRNMQERGNMPDRE